MRKVSGSKRLVTDTTTESARKCWDERLWCANAD